MPRESMDRRGKTGKLSVEGVEPPAGKEEFTGDL
jgi:hypothetical protein